MSQYSSHSADVQAWLECEQGNRIELSRVTPKSLFAKSPQEVPAGHFDLVVIVDGIRLSSTVYLVNGFTKDRLASLIQRADDIAPF